MQYQKFADRDLAIAAAEVFHGQFGEPIIVLEDTRGSEFLIADPVAFQYWRDDLKERYEIIRRFEAEKISGK